MVIVGDRLRTKTKRRSPSPPPDSVQFDYIIHIQEIKPWPPSQSLRTSGAVLVQWEEHDYNRRRTCRSGLTNQVVPSLNGRIEFNESFTLPLKLEQDKCVIEFNLYEPGRDKTAKGWPLGTAVLDLPDYYCGRLVKEDLSVSVPVNCKRSYRNSVQPLLYLKIQPVERTQTRPSASVSALMSEEYAEEANEPASFSTTDDDNDVSLHSSMAFSASAAHSIETSSPQNKGKETISVNGSAGEGTFDHVLLKQGEAQLATETHYRSSSCYISKETEDGPLGDFFHFDNQKQVKNGLLSSRSTRSTRINHLIGGENRKDTANKVVPTRPGRRVVSSDSSRKILQLENRIEVLEGELIEAAAMEFSLYSVVAEHGSSMSKVHAPARRLSRLYFHSKSGRRGTAAKSVVSGLLVVAKTCGNDVPRLTFWLSNTIALRVIVNNYIGDKNGNLKKKNKHVPRSNNSSIGTRDDSLSEDWENPPLMFAAAVERVEAWIFSRIIESLWWQTFTPRMQSHAAKAIRTSKDSYPMTSLDHQQGKFSLELWKKAFRDACERICPVRAGGHDCGCLPVLSKLIMEQLITRLDVAMFNAILRESKDDIPTDPVADPISDAEVLPIPTWKASFGAGAQLKNAIGNWSRWLSDLFGIDDDDDDDDVLHANENYSETVVDDDDNKNNNERRSSDQSSKCFHLLNSLSDLMMLPKDMLLSPRIRKEVFLSIGLSLVRRIINSFVPDEFCPDPIPQAVLEALYAEDSEEDFVMSFPCAAAPVVYQAPSSAFFGSSHSKTKLSESSILLKKSQTSDDELDELNSALKAITLDGFQSLPLLMPCTSKDIESQNTVRYKLLKKVWANRQSQL